jgi:diguanylate cyclase (GGDEF)-like protein/PAS domain S-box-containing protein
MGAVEILPDSTIALSPAVVPTHWLAAGVACASIAILLLCCAGLSLDLRERSRSAETARIRELADAAIEGLILCNGEVIVSANRSFSKLVGQGPEDICRQSFAAFIPEQDVRAKLLARASQSIETELRCQDGSLIPVELISGTIMYSGHLHHVVAIRDLRERKEAEAQIRFLAHHDPLTRLANRASFSQELDHEIELHRMSGRQLAVLYLDLDRFKEVNDLYGHAAGDQLLQDVAKRLSSVLNEHQMLARLGGDEFAIIVPGIKGPAQAERLAERILKSFTDNGAAEGLVSLISVSIGIAKYPFDAEDCTTLLSSADTALYRAKVEGKGTFRFFEPAMEDEARERRALDHDLRHAIVKGELSLVYQPQAQIGTGEVTGFEALLRWNHPRRGEVPPAVFIPLAEESGLILSIGEWVLREACLEAASWTRPLNLAVNVSAVQLTSNGFAELVRATLVETRLPPERLEIEVTETALIRDPARAHQALKGLAALGIQIAIDDFGTGYSSLSNLRAFPFSKIKIDGSFIQAIHTNPQAATIVRAVLGLGHGLGLPIVAEGVETLDELHFLEAEGCTQAQGYLLAHPAPIHDFRALTCSHVAPTPDLITHGLTMGKQRSRS